MKITMHNAKPEDAELLYALRSDTNADAFSVGDAPKNMAEHTAWLEDVLNDRMRHLVIFRAVGGDNPPVACGRVDHDSTERKAELSLTIGPLYRKRGLAKGLINRLVTRAQQGGSHYLTATVKVDNEPSLRAFFSADFHINHFDADGETLRLFRHAD